MTVFLRAAIEEAELGLREGGIPIGAVLVHDGRIIGRGHNRRVQQGSATLHGEMDALERAGRQPASVYRGSTVDDARAAAAAGADVIVAQGGEAGGHRSIDGKPASPDATAVGVMALLPQVVDAVRVPVVAAGGIADGRGLVAALALGASGVLLGTRFVATRESMAPELYKKRLLESDSGDTTLTDTLSGLWARALTNRFTREYTEARAPILPPLIQRSAASDVFIASLKQGDPDYYPMMAGQSVGLVRDVPGAGEVVTTVIREAQAVLRELPGRIRQT